MMKLDNLKELVKLNELQEDLQRNYELIDFRYNVHSYKLQIKLDEMYLFDIPFEKAKEILGFLLNDVKKNISTLKTLVKEELNDTNFNN